MRKLIDHYHRFLKVVLGVLMGVLIIPVSLQIFSRYVGFIPRYIWTEELARFCFIWIILVGATIAVRDGSHFTADFLPHPKSRRVEAVMRMVSDFAIFLVAVIFIWWGWPLVQFGLLQESEMAELPMVYIYAAWPFAGISWTLFLGERFVDHARMFRGYRRVSPGEVAGILFPVFVILVLLRVPVAFALGLACVPVFMLEERLAPQLLMNEMFKSYNAFVLLAVPFFLLAANLMNAAGITDRLVRLSRALVGHLPGGLGHINVVVSMLFAGISGSSTADAAGIGSLLIPQMKRQGYSASFTVAITACSSVMGVIIPPSILMVVWGGLMSVSIGGLFLAGVLPGVLIALSMMCTVYVYAKIYGYPVYERSNLREAGIAVLQAIPPLMTPVIIVGGIVGGFFTPTEASAIAVLYSLLLGGLIYKTVGLRAIPRVLYESARFAAISLFCIGTASAFGWILAYFKIPQEIVNFLQPYGVGIVSTGFIVAVAFLFIGMFIDAIPAIIILGTVLWPLAEVSNMHPIHFAIIGVISLAFGLVTPPYGLCLLIACSIGQIKVHEALKDVAIVLLPMLGVLLVVILLPELILALPRWLLPRFV